MPVRRYRLPPAGSPSPCSFPPRVLHLHSALLILQESKSFCVGVRGGGTRDLLVPVSAHVSPFLLRVLTAVAAATGTSSSTLPRWRLSVLVELIILIRSPGGDEWDREDGF